MDFIFSIAMTKAQADQKYDRLTAQQDALAEEAESFEADIDTMESEIADWQEEKKALDQQIARNRADIKTLKAQASKIWAKHERLESEKTQLIRDFDL